LARKENPVRSASLSVCLEAEPAYQLKDENYIPKISCILLLRRI